MTTSRIRLLLSGTFTLSSQGEAIHTVKYRKYGNIGEEFLG
jgi:hypothetical protein